MDARAVSSIVSQPRLSRETRLQIELLVKQSGRKLAETSVNARDCLSGAGLTAGCRFQVGQLFNEERQLGFRAE